MKNKPTTRAMPAGLTANARLIIAAAPDLIAACEMSRRNVGSILQMLPLNADKAERKSLEKWLGKLNAALGNAGLF